ncbi:hypothetical protein J6K35_01470 [bacterium]|nr:hypothetical protein [bacterium]
MKIDFVTQWKDVIFQKQKKDNFSSQKQKDNRDKLLYYTLGGLALAAAGAVLYNKKAGSNKTFLIKTNTYQDLRQSVSSRQMEEIEQKAAVLDNYQLINELEVSHDKDIFKRLAAVMHLNKLESVECPKLITTNAPDEKLNDICNFFQSEFKFSSKNLKYDNNISELIKSIDKQCKPGEKNAGVCVSINNFDQFLKDLNKDEELKQKFFDILEQSNNNIIFIGNVSSKDSVVLNNQIFLPFKL